MRRLLVGVEGSQSDLAVIEAVRALCEGRAGAAVTLVHVIEPSTPDARRAWLAGDEGAGAIAPDRAERARRAQDQLVATLEAAGIPVRVEIIGGVPGEAMCSFARAGGYELIVVGRRGLGRLEQLRLGSVGEAVIRGAHLPVLIVQ
jgi:nucleotide-binding universal stress UspA family protein